MAKQRWEPERDRQAALQIFTYKLIQQACQENPVAIEWENYPEIGEDDWLQLLMRVKDQTNYGPGTKSMYDRAYKTLTERANNASKE